MPDLSKLNEQQRTKLEKLQNRIKKLKQELQEAIKHNEKPEIIRRLKKLLKRAQRKYRKMLPLTLDEKIDQTQKRLDNLSKILQDLERQIKYKPGEKPKVHSLRKKVKGLTTKLKKLQKLQSKKQKKQ